eukprot:12937856-Alexandrium_andersonii.AAC.1
MALACGWSPSLPSIGAAVGRAGAPWAPAGLGADRGHILLGCLGSFVVAPSWGCPRGPTTSLPRGAPSSLRATFWSPPCGNWRPGQPQPRPNKICALRPNS